MSDRISRKEFHSKKFKTKQRKWTLPKIIGFIALLSLIALIGVMGYSYYQFNQSFEKVYNPQVEKEIVKVREEEVSVGEDSISILALGIDTGEFDRSGGGRSDIMMVMTYNPSTDKAIMTSIPRDTYTEIVGRGTNDKLNHAYAFGGVPMAVNSVQNLLDIPIDYFVTVDMGGFEEIVDHFGGLMISPLETFDQEGYSFQQGVSQVMDGRTTLQYIRNRFTEKGDYGRQERARQVISALVEKSISIEGIANLPNLITTFADYVETNIKLDEIQSLGVRSKNIMDNLEVLQLVGRSEMIDGVAYEVIEPDSLEAVKKELKNNLDL